MPTHQAATTKPLTPAELARLQEIVSTLLFNARAVDSTMFFVALVTLTSSQSQGTEATVKSLTHLLNYCATHPNATIRFTNLNGNKD
jgi:hypothetical protein